MATGSGSGSPTGPVVPSYSAAAPSEAPPLPVSATFLRGYFNGLESYLYSASRVQYRTAATDVVASGLFLETHIRAAQNRLEELSRRRFFVTRFCTQELAAQLSLTLGAAGDNGYDEIIQGATYDVDQFRSVSARQELDWKPVVGNIQNYMLTMSQSAKIAQVPITWCQVDAEHGVVHLMPQALTELGLTYFTIFALNPLVYRPGLGTLVPLLVHIRYRAGYCERTAVGGSAPYDPDAEQYNSIWPQNLIAEYRTYIAQFAAARVYRILGPRITRGGVNLSIDGVSRSANNQTLTMLADQYERDAREWAQGSLGARNGWAAAWV